MDNYEDYHYFVPCAGHIAWFLEYYEALSFAHEYGSRVWNGAGLRQ